MSARGWPPSLFPSGPCSLRATLGTPRLGTPLPQCDVSFSPAQGHQSRQWCQAPGRGRNAPCPAGCTLGPGQAWPCLLRGLAVPGAGHLQTERNRSEPPGPGEEMAAWAGPEQDPGRRAGGRSGRKAPGWAGQRAGGPPPRSGRQGWPPGLVCVCAHVYLRAGARATGTVSSPRFPSGTWRSWGGELMRWREHPVHLWKKGRGKNDSYYKASVLLN